MKLTRDNYELILFDLLEGNIPEKDVANLMAQIEADDFLSKEWALFQSTVLIPDESIVYPNKAALVKKDNTVISMRTWMSIAVAASIVFAFFIYLPQFSSDNKPVNISSDIAPSTESPKNTPQERATVKPDAPEVGIERPAIDQMVSTEYARPKTDGTDKDTENVESIPQEEFQLLGNRNAPALFANNAPSTVDNISSMNVPFIAVEPVTYNRTERITGTASVVMARLANPGLKVKPNWNQRKLDIEFESDGYYALASITPFTKKK